MSLVLNGTTQFISSNAAPFTTYPFTLFGYFNANVANAEQHFFDVCNSTAAAINGFRMRAAATGLLRITVGDGVGTAANSTSTSYTASTWFRGVYLGNSATSRDVRLNNAGSTISATNLTPTGVDKCFIGCANLNGVFSQFFGGSLAHMAGWNVALGTTDLARLEAGISPMYVSRANLRFYLPLFADLTDLVGTLTWSGTNSPTFGADTPVRTPQLATMGVY